MTMLDSHLAVVKLKLFQLPERKPILKLNEITIQEKDQYINKSSSLKLIVLPSEVAMNYRKKYIRGWVVPGSCNLYIGLLVDNVLTGVLGFKNAEIGTYDLMLKADTTNSNNKYSIDLLLYCMRSVECKKLLELKFNREIRTLYSMCFSSHSDIARYRKHGELTKKVEVGVGFNIAYTFNTGSIPSIKAAKMEFFQKHKDL